MDYMYLLRTHVKKREKMTGLRPSRLMLMLCGVSTPQANLKYSE